MKRRYAPKQSFIPSFSKASHGKKRLGILLSVFGLLWVIGVLILDQVLSILPYPLQLFFYAAGVILCLVGAILDRPL